MARTDYDTGMLRGTQPETMRHPRAPMKGEAPEEITATEAKQGRWGTHVLTVLIVSGSLAVIAMAYFVFA